MTTTNRITIDLPHPNTRNAEAFLNSWEEPFIQAQDGTNTFVFISAVSQTKIALQFFNSYEEANSFGMKHYHPDSEKRRWGINGALLFVVSGDNANKISSLISHFAGRE
ncbi:MULTISPECIES: hypothetical protein [Niastella]|uniref:ABM domain-containing protein n=1 Tax=Niastella soli TaxID=2821487 RepID=A0ABS3YW11_9BACT|nr:hypothetical protein [Niastella soli]MBO9202116.1 hypothetical protein [Niastella soli]